MARGNLILYLSRCTDRRALIFRNLGGVFAILGLIVKHGSQQPSQLPFGVDRLTIFLILFGCVVVCAAMTVILQRKVDRRIERAANGMCEQCGYDLRSSRQRCPECNTPIKPERRYPLLPKFLGYHFWLEWQKKANSDSEVLSQALEEEPEYEIRKIIEQLDGFLAEQFEESQVARILTEKFGCHFDPQEQNETAIGWLTSVRVRLQAGLERIA